MRFQKGEDFASVSAFTDDFDAGDVLELIGQLAAGRQFVVGDKSTDFFHGILLLGKWVGVQGSRFRVVVAASPRIYGAMPESGISVTSP